MPLTPHLVSFGMSSIMASLNETPYEGRSEHI